MFLFSNYAKIPTEDEKRSFEDIAAVGGEKSGIFREETKGGGWGTGETSVKREHNTDRKSQEEGKAKERETNKGGK